MSRRLRELIDAIEHHSEVGAEWRRLGKGYGQWTHEDSLLAIGAMSKEMRQVIDANRLAPGSEYALIPDPKREGV